MRNITKRGGIYKWREGMTDEKNVLVVSSDSRGNERFVSVLMFGNSSVGKDVVEFNYESLGDYKYVHCGMLTYVLREEMADQPFVTAREKTMAIVDRHLCSQLGIVAEDTLAELRFYKRKCDELIEKYTGVRSDL